MKLEVVCKRAHQTGGVNECLKQLAPISGSPCKAEVTFCSLTF